MTIGLFDYDKRVLYTYFNGLWFPFELRGVPSDVQIGYQVHFSIFNRRSMYATCSRWMRRTCNHPVAYRG